MPQTYDIGQPAFEILVTERCRFFFYIPQDADILYGEFDTRGIDAVEIRGDARKSIVGKRISVVIALAVFPWLMRKLTKIRSKPGLEHIATAFAFGFFLDLAKVALIAASVGVKNI